MVLILLFPSVAQAMETADFYTLSDANKKNYLILMIEGTRDNLTAQGKVDDAKKVVDLFTTEAPDKKGSIGAEGFFGEANSARAFNKKHPDNLIEMEQVFLFTINKFKLDTDLGDLEKLSATFKPSPPGATQ